MTTLITFISAPVMKVGEVYYLIGRIIVVNKICEMLKKFKDFIIYEFIYSGSSSSIFKCKS